MDTPIPTNLLETADNLHVWSDQLVDGWERLEQIAVVLDLQRDVLIPVSYDQVADAAGHKQVRVTLMGLRYMDNRWQLAIGTGPEHVRHWDDQWVWTPRTNWGRHLCILASSKLDHLLAALNAATCEIAEEVESATAHVNEIVHRICSDNDVTIGAEPENC